MDFGRVPYEQLDSIDFRLPADPEFNRRVLLNGPVPSPKAYVGSNKWGRKEWIGILYPKGTKDAQFLDEYVKHYNAIEMNATHYKLYAPDAVKKWTDKVKDHDFLFCPKVYQGISHYGSFDDKQFLTDTFLGNITAFQNHLGPTYLQVSDKFGPKRQEELFKYLKTLPTDISLFLEVRHPDWFEKGRFLELVKTLKSLNIGIVNTDTAGRRDVLHSTLTVPKAIVRFVTNENHPSNYTRMDDWIERIRLWLHTGLEELYFFFHCGDERYFPVLSQYFIRRLNKEFNLGVREPKIIGQN